MPFLRFLWRCFGVVSYLPSSPNATGSGESSYSNGLKGVDEPVAIYAVATLSHPTDHRLQAHTVKRIFFAVLLAISFLRFSFPLPRLVGSQPDVWLRKCAPNIFHIFCTSSMRSNRLALGCRMILG